MYYPCNYDSMIHPSSSEQMQPSRAIVLKNLKGAKHPVTSISNITLQDKLGLYDEIANFL